MSGIFGRTLGMPFAQWSQDSSCWKTSEDISLWDLPMSLETLPPWGCLLDGELFELPMPELLTTEQGFSSLLLSTPDTMPEAPNSGSNRRSHPSGLLNQVLAAELLPTARATSSMAQPLDTTLSMYRNRGHSKFRLEETIAILFPTPTVNDMGAGKDPQKWQEWTAKMRQAHGNGNGHGKSLEQEALLISANTSQLSIDGNASSDDLLQHLPFDETIEID